MKSLNLVAFDLGASSGRAILGTMSGNRLAIRPVHQFSNGPVDLNGHLFWDVLRFVSEIKEGLSRASSVASGSLASLGIDTWGVDYGLLDSSGQLLGVPFHYRDQRTAGMFDEAFRRMEKKKIFEYTGVAFQPFNTLFQLLSMRVNSPEILDQARTLLMMPDLLSYFLTGTKATEYTDASTSQLLDAGKRTWSTAIIEAMGFPHRIFTDIQEPGTVRGTLLASVANELRLASIPVIAVASHDTASAVVSVPSEGSDHAYLSSGTWSLLGVETAMPAVHEKALQWNFTNEGGFGGTYRLLRNVMGLWIVQECRRQWNAEGDPIGFEEMVEIAGQAAPLASFVDPDDGSFYNPGDMPIKVRQYCTNTGQRIPGSKGEIVRCVFESLALKYRWVVEKIEDITGRRIERLYLVGGGVKNQLLNQFTANALNRTVIGSLSEATAVGNLMVQAYALGEVSGVEQIREVVRNSFPTTTFLPQETNRWDDAYGRFSDLLRSGG